MVWTRFTSLGIKTHIVIAFFIRILFILWGEYQDSVMSVKYTDIDYHVFTDAARHIVEGSSPFSRPTYRYTCLLAWFLTPNVTLHFIYGKILFSLCDVMVGNLIYYIMSLECGCDVIRKYAVFFWIYNPFTIAISTRGNAESIVVLAVLLALYLHKQNALILSGFFYGLAVHFKLYPVIYCLPFYTSLGHSTSWQQCFKPNAQKIEFALSAIFSFTIFTGLNYFMYGNEYLEEAVFYHFFRKDIRHNFSVYFYLLYLTNDLESPLLEFVTFIPQLVIVLALAVRFGNKCDLSYCVFSQTFIFVTYNKVCTSQYYIWYLSLLPICLHRIHLSILEAFVLVMIWVFAQGSWLLPAYFLEFEGRNTFLYIWMEGVAFFCGNVGIFAKLTRKYLSLGNDTVELLNR